MRTLFEWIGAVLPTTVIKKSATGTMSILLGVGISLQNIEQWLRIVALLVGIAGGVATLISIINHNRKEK